MDVKNNRFCIHSCRFYRISKHSVGLHITTTGFLSDSVGFHADSVGFHTVVSRISYSILQDLIQILQILFSQTLWGFINMF